MEVQFNFTGKRFVVTGASSGIGRQIAQELANAGADVLTIARRAGELEKLLNEYPERITVAPVDVTDMEAMEKSITAFVVDKGKIDGSVHAAGLLKFTPLRAFNFNEAKRMMDVNLWASIFLIQLVTKKKYAANSTAHVQFSSVSSQKGQIGLSAYSATKAAIEVAVRSLAKEVANRGHRINTISPGWVETNMTKDTLVNEDVSGDHLLGLGSVEDVAGLVLFLLSDRAKWITGTNYVVDGGYLA